MKRLPFVFVLVLLFAEFFPGFAQSRSRDASIGIWPMLAGNIDSYIDEIVAKARSTGLDTLYLHVWRTTGSQKGELWIQDEAGTWDPKDGTLRPRVYLKSFLRKAHAAGLQVVVVIQVFASGGPYPSDHAHQKFLVEKVCRYLVHSYDTNGMPVYPIDGIALDYIRWFGGNHDQKDVNRFIDTLRAEVGSLPLHAFLIAGAYAVDGPTYDNKFRGYSAFQWYVRTNYGQDWEDLARRCEVLMPMTYTANGHVYGNNLALMEGFVREAASYARTAVNRAGSTSRIVPAIRTWNSSGETTTRATVEACARGALKGAAHGFMAFRYFTARGHNDWFQGLATWAEPGPDLPIAGLTSTNDRLGFASDTTASWHTKWKPDQLRVTFDFDGDNWFETAPAPPSVQHWILKSSGTHTIRAKVVDPNGNYAITATRFRTGTVLQAASSSVSAAGGGRVAMTLASGLATGDHYYVVFSTLSGVGDGPLLPGGVRVPIRFDTFTSLGLAELNHGPFQGFFGQLNFFGLGSPALVMPKGLIPASLVGSKMHFAAVGLDPTALAPRFASNPVEVGIVR